MPNIYTIYYILYVCVKSYENSYIYILFFYIVDCIDSYTIPVKRFICWAIEEKKYILFQPISACVGSLIGPRPRYHINSAFMVFQLAFLHTSPFVPCLSQGIIQQDIYLLHRDHILIFERHIKIFLNFGKLKSQQRSHLVSHKIYRLTLYRVAEYK